MVPVFRGRETRTAAYESQVSVKNDILCTLIKLVLNISKYHSLVTMIVLMFMLHLIIVFMKHKQTYKTFFSKLLALKAKSWPPIQSNKDWSA